MTDLDMTKPISTLELQKSAKDSRFRKCLKITFEDYCQHTSLNGLQYVGDRSRPLKERIFWISIFCVSICYCIYSVHSVYSKWQNTPVIVTFAEKSTPVWNIPFPAVTICSETKRVLKKENVNSYAYLEKMYSNYSGDIFQPQNVSALEMEEFRTLLHVCNPHLLEEKIPRIPGEVLNYIEILERMLPEFNRSYLECDWIKTDNDCDKFLRKTVTDEGICYTYNGLAPTDIFREDTFQYHYPNELENLTRSSWRLEKGYDVASDVTTYPGRVLSSGLRSAFQIFLHSAKEDVDYGCRGAVQGFKVILHSPEDVPHVSLQFTRIPLNQEVLIAVKPKMITTSEGIAAYSSIRRQCFLIHERYLRFFKIYSQSNCQMECLANFTLSKCGCVKFSLPRSLDTPVCNEKDIYCYTDAEDEILVSEFHRVRNQNVPGGSPSNYTGAACNCLPACTSLTYSTEISQAKFELVKTLNAYGDTEFKRNFPGAQVSTLLIYFKESEFITSKRSELYGFMEFLGNSGGIFGLFISFSILSLVEFIYFFTFRFWENLNQLRKVNPP